MQYEEWMEEGKRNILKRALQLIEQSGLIPPHQLYITFRTDYPNTQMPSALRTAYPEEMSIAIKDAFWNLNVTDDAFSLELLFDDQRHMIRVPFKGVVSFVDPGAEFGLKFDWRKNVPEQRDDNIIFLDRFRKNP